jgi:MSHA biogenesis protein MshK
MAEHLSKAANKRTVMGRVLMGMLAVIHAHSLAQTLSDPTRPPASLDVTQNQSVSTSAPVLQSVLISPQRMVAIISGKTVTLGEKVGEANVVKITESEVVLRNGKEIQVLKLFPIVEKRWSSSRVGSKIDSQRQ